MRGHVDAERLEQVAAFVAVALGRVDLVEQVAMAVVIGLQPRENSGLGHIRLPWRLEKIRITETAVQAVAIGRAAWRIRGWQYVEMPVVDEVVKVQRQK